jgi:hypothetical protein
MLEIPPLTWRLFGANIPVGGGGYFRLLPRFLLNFALEQYRRHCRPCVGMLYFHPWEFDPQQERLPLGRACRFRTYVGLFRSRERLLTLLRKYRYVRAVDMVDRIDLAALPHFSLLPGVGTSPAGLENNPAIPPLQGDVNKNLQPA